MVHVFNLFVLTALVLATGILAVEAESKYINNKDKVYTQEHLEILKRAFWYKVFFIVLFYFSLYVDIFLLYLILLFTKKRPTD